MKKMPSLTEYSLAFPDCVVPPTVAVATSVSMEDVRVELATRLARAT
jgi:hypothetical protein